MGSVMELLYYFLGGCAGVVASYFMSAWAIRWWPFSDSVSLPAAGYIPMMPYRLKNGKWAYLSHRKQQSTKGR